MENVVEVRLGGKGKGVIVWFVECWTCRKGEVKSGCVTFGEELFGWGVVKEEAVGFRTAANTDAFECVGVKFG